MSEGQLCVLEITKRLSMGPENPGYLCVCVYECVMVCTGNSKRIMVL